MLTYNTEFIDANFANYGNLAGVFTVCETNIEVPKKIEALQADKSAVAEEYKKKSVAAESKQNNIIETGFDAEQIKEVFKMIFEAMQQEQHYKMMMNVES